MSELIPDWISNFGVDVPTPFIPNTKRKIKEDPLRKYELSWEVPYGTRKLWIQGAKTTVLIRKFLRAGDTVFNIKINRLDDHVLVPNSNNHRHWVNDIELDHAWELCDINPINFLFFT